MGGCEVTRHVESTVNTDLHMKLQGQATKGGGEDDKGTSNAEQNTLTHVHSAEWLIKGQAKSGGEDESARGQLTTTTSTQTWAAQLLPLTLMFEVRHTHTHTYSCSVECIKMDPPCLQSFSLAFPIQINNPKEPIKLLSVIVRVL